MHTHSEHAHAHTAREFLELEHCLSCERPLADGLFCDECVERSKQRLLIKELDDLGVAD